MNYELPLNFGRSQTVDPTNGMTRHQFLCLLEQNNISLDESRMAEVNYYFNLWGDTMKQNRKSGQPYDFDAYIAWMKKQ
jgi:hypothetical protein|tara:strand:- start:1738 stop:1974 length:237 start_codon:yes stop_codon:yes gene_type:complete